jgi:hypothetical protein
VRFRDLPLPAVTSIAGCQACVALAYQLSIAIELPLSADSVEKGALAAMVVVGGAGP